VILAQKDEYIDEYVIAYDSKKLNKHQVNYSISEKECLAVIFGIKQFRHYLFGTEFLVVTDHSALVWLFGMNNPTNRLARWEIFLQDFNLKIVHRKGEHHSNVDALSRPVLHVTGFPDSEMVNENEVMDAAIKCLDVYEDEFLLHFLKFGQHLDGASNKQVKRVKMLSDKYKMIEHCVYYLIDPINMVLVKVPRPLERKQLILKAHSLGHFALFTKLETVYNTLKQDFYWKNMLKDIEYYVKQCVECIRNKKYKFKNHPAMAIEVEGVFDTIFIDLIGGLPATEDGFKYILVIVAYISEIFNHICRYICIFGPLKRIVSDNGLEFKNQLMNQL
jgi:hypothetical protein